MFSISMKTNLSLVLRSSHINLIQIKKKEATKNLYKLIIVYHGMWYCVKKRVLWNFSWMAGCKTRQNGQYMGVMFKRE